MSCNRALEIDVEDYLIESDAPRFDAFRAHFPTCPECSDQVTAWTAFDAALRAEFANELDRDDGHPSETALADHVRQRRAGSPSSDLGAHLERCAACRNEVALLSSFDAQALRTATAPDVLTDSAAATAPGERPAASPLEPLRAFMTSIAETLFAPGPARWAVPAMLVLFAVLSVFLARNPDRYAPESSRSTDAPALIAERPAETPAPLIDPGTTPAPSPSPSEAPGVLGAPGVPIVPVAPEAPGTDAPTQLAERPTIPTTPTTPTAPHPATPEPVVPPTRRPSDPSGSPNRLPNLLTNTTEPDTRPREVVLLASLDALPPAYAARAAGRVDWMARYGDVRSAASIDLPKISTLAPVDHVGESLNPSPTLWWHLDRASESAVMLTVTTADAIDPTLEQRIAGPLEAGDHSFDLGAYGVSLEPGIDYRWFVSLEVDPDRPSRNPVATGALRIVSEDDPRHDVLSNEAESRQGHTFAAQGLWYDAYDFFASLARSHPDSRAAAHRAHLADSIADSTDASQETDPR